MNAYRALHKRVHILAIFFGVAGLFFQPIFAAAALTISSIPLIATNDPFVKKQSYLDQINARAAWGLTTGSVRTTIAVIDSGVDIYHPDLRDNIWVNQGEIPGDGIDNDDDGYIDDVNGWDFVNAVPDPSPKFTGNWRPAGIQHGTLLAGIMSARGNNGLGIAGISWRTKILPLRVLDGNGDGDVINVIRAIDYAILKKVDVINMSFVGDTDTPLFRDAIKRAHDANIIIVAATGNDENRHGIDLKDKPVYPACYDFYENAVIGVASVDDLSQKASFSNYGGCVDIFAPGVGFFSTQVVNYEHPGFDTYYGTGWTGTSISTAVISGAAALVKSVNQDFTSNDVTKILVSTCDPIDDVNPQYAGKMGCGKLNVYRAVERAISVSQGVGGLAEESPLKNSLFVYPLLAEQTGTFYTKEGKSAGRAPFLPFGKGVPFSIALLKDHGTVLYVASTGKGPSSLVKIFDDSFQSVMSFTPYNKGFRGGASVAVGDVDGDGAEEIVTVPGAGGGPDVRIFDQSGSVKYHFLAYAPSFRDGLSVAVGDMNNDGVMDIVTTPQKNYQGDVRVFNANGVLRTQFFSYPRSKNGARVALGDLDGDGTIEIVTAPVTGAAPVKIFSSIGKLKNSFYPFDKRYAGGISLTVGNLNQDRYGAIICAPAGKGGAHVRVFTGSGRATNQFMAMKEYKNGIGVAITY